MPMLESYLAELNREFSKENIARFAEQRRGHFGHGQPLDLDFLHEDETLQRAWRGYFGQVPESIREAVRGVILHALSTDPPTPVTFAWAPGYDFELNLWHSADSRLTRGGITVLIRSRYPDDPSPVRGG